MDAVTQIALEARAGWEKQAGMFSWLPRLGGALARSGRSLFGRGASRAVSTGESLAGTAGGAARRVVQPRIGGVPHAELPKPIFGEVPAPHHPLFDDPLPNTRAFEPMPGPPLPAAASAMPPPLPGPGAMPPPLSESPGSSGLRRALFGAGAAGGLGGLGFGGYAFDRHLQNRAKYDVDPSWNYRANANPDADAIFKSNTQAHSNLTSRLADQINTAAQAGDRDKVRTLQAQLDRGDVPSESWLSPSAAQHQAWAAKAQTSQQKKLDELRKPFLPQKGDEESLQSLRKRLTDETLMPTQRNALQWQVDALKKRLSPSSPGTESPEVARLIAGMRGAGMNVSGYPEVRTGNSDATSASYWRHSGHPNAAEVGGWYYGNDYGTDPAAHQTDLQNDWDKEIRPGVR